MSSLVIGKLLYIVALVVALLVVIAVEAPKKNGGRTNLRLMIYPNAIVWLVILVAAELKGRGFAPTDTVWGIRGVAAFCIVTGSYFCYRVRVWNSVRALYLRIVKRST